VKPAARQFAEGTLRQIRRWRLVPKRGTAMAVNKPVGDYARKGAVRKRSQLKTKIAGEAHWTKRSKSSGRYIDQKKSASATPFKGVRKEKPTEGK
jgi:hypothetical protein